MQLTWNNKTYHNCNKTCNSATKWAAGATCQRTRTASEGCLSDGVWATDRRMEQPRTGALVNIHRLKSCRVIGCIIIYMYLIMHNSSATVLAVLSFRF